jgi:arylformamidase
MTRVFDISLPITPDMVIYPGTRKTSIRQVTSKSGSSILSEIELTSHTGTHIDAPNHVIEDGEGIDSIPLNTFYGRCRVIDMTHCEAEITEKDLKHAKIREGERLLFKTTNSIRGFETFYEDYVYLSGESAEFLAERRVLLVGIDSLSVKKRGLSDNTAHSALLSENIPIIEGLNLSAVEKGEYTLCAFPLSFKGIDGSPVRAVLLSSS